MTRCLYCGDEHDVVVFAERDCPNSMGDDAASAVMTAARRNLIVPPQAPRKSP